MCVCVCACIGGAISCAFELCACGAGAPRGADTAVVPRVVWVLATRPTSRAWRAIPIGYRRRTVVAERGPTSGQARLARTPEPDGGGRSTSM